MALAWPIAQDCSGFMIPANIFVFKSIIFALWHFAFVSLFNPVPINSESCPANPTTTTICSQDHSYVDAMGSIQVAGKCAAGNTCECSSDFTGKACELPIRAGATNVLMNSWAFLAKSCWTANSQGSIDVTITYTSLNCSAGSGCRPENVTLSDRLPHIIFYSSYDKSFSQSVLKSFYRKCFV